MQPPAAEEVRQIIREAADRHALKRRVALAFAWCESRLNPLAEGDLGWHLRQGGALYRRKVLGNPDFVSNPARDEPEVWHSYGLYQLLACYHARPLEHPRRLLDPFVNADRGCAQIARLLERASGDVTRARLAYTGAGLDGEHVGAGQRTLTTARLMMALERFRGERETR